MDDAGGGKPGCVPPKKNELLARLPVGGKLFYGKVGEVEFSEYSSWMTVSAMKS